MGTVFSYVALGCGVLVLLAWIVLLSFFGYHFVRSLHKQDDPDPDIRLSYFPGEWRYHFTDPYDKRIGSIGYGSRRKAMKMAIKHRELVGRELEESVGLHLPAYQPEINNKEEL